MTQSADTVRVFIPLARRRRNGRPRILAPEPKEQFQSRTQDAHILRVLGRAWAWRRRLDSGQAATIQDLAQADKLTHRYVSRIMRLSYLSPDVLERLVVWREPPAVSINELIEISRLPWSEQMGRVFDHQAARYEQATASAPRITKAAG